MRKMNLFSVIFLLTMLGGCASTVDRITSDHDSAVCAEAENAGNMVLAAEACYRAYITVDRANLGAKLKSEKLYNWGRVLREAGRYTLAREALTKSLEIEKKLSGKNSIKCGRRLAELSATYLETKQWEKGIEYIDAVIPIADQYTDNEKHFIAALLYFYADKLSATQKEKADSYHNTMQQLGYSKTNLEKQINNFEKKR